MKTLSQICMAVALSFVVCHGSLAQLTGYALQFDGVDDYVNIPDDVSFDLSISRVFTAECWAKLDTVPSPEGQILGKWGAGGDVDDEWSLTVRLTGLEFAVNSSTTSGSPNSSVITTNGQVPLGQWIHIACEWNGNVQSQQLYVNGVLVQENNSAVSTMPNTSTPFRVGYNGAGGVFKGAIDEVRVWNIARNQSQIQETIKRSLTGLEAGLVGYWRFDEGSGTTAYDFSSHGNNGTLVNGPTWIPMPQPFLISAKDVPNDQGGSITLIWQASPLDTNVTTLPFYSIWRASPQNTQGTSNGTTIRDLRAGFTGSAYRTESSATTKYSWEWIGNQPAHRFTTYAFTASTLYDSSARTQGTHYFLISAHTNDPNMFYDSNVDSGYSVDNLPPHSPSGLAGNLVAGKVLLHWTPNLENDIARYEVYRSAVPNFDSDTASVYAATSDTLYSDSNVIQNTNLYYAIRAVDIHDNRSPRSGEVAIIFVNVAENASGVPTQFALRQNYPNPFNPSTTIGFSLPRAAHAVLKVFNTLGEEIETLISEELGAGTYTTRWDAASIASGVYFYRLQAGSYVETKKLILLR